MALAGLSGLQHPARRPDKAFMPPSGKSLPVVVIHIQPLTINNDIAPFGAESNRCPANRVQQLRVLGKPVRQSGERLRVHFLFAVDLASATINKVIHLPS